MERRALAGGVGFLVILAGVLAAARRAAASVPPPPAFPGSVVESLPETGLPPSSSPEGQAVRSALAPYDPAIEAASSTWGVEADLLRAVIWRESHGNPNAMGDLEDPRGPSYGLGQVLLATARDMGFPGSPSELLDPQVNLYYTAEYLRGRLDATEDPLLAVSAYNAGTPRYHTGSLPAAKQQAHDAYVDDVAANYSALTGTALV